MRSIEEPSTADVIAFLDAMGDLVLCHRHDGSAKVRPMKIEGRPATARSLAQIIRGWPPAERVHMSRGSGVAQAIKSIELVGDGGDAATDRLVITWDEDDLIFLDRKG